MHSHHLMWYMLCILWPQDLNAIWISSHIRISKPSQAGHCGHAATVFSIVHTVVSLKLLFQSAGLLQNIMHFEKPLILRLFPQRMIQFILVDKNNSCDAYSAVRCCTQYEFPHGKHLQWNDKLEQKQNNWLKKFMISIAFHRKKN